MYVTLAVATCVIAADCVICDEFFNRLSERFHKKLIIELSDFLYCLSDF